VRAQGDAGIDMRSARLAMIQTVPATMMVKSKVENRMRCRSSRFCLKPICRKHRKCTTNCTNANTPMTISRGNRGMSAQCTRANGTKVSSSPRPNPQT
jgi:hypothetical protein